MKKRSTLKRVLVYIRNYKGLAFLAFISAILYVSATLYAPILTGNILDELVDTGEILIGTVNKYLIILSIVILMGAFFGYVMNYLISKMTYLIVRDMRIKLFNKIMELPIKVIDSNPHGDLLSRVITDVDTVSEGILQFFTEAFTGIITILVTLVFMMMLNYKIGLIVVCLTPLSLIGATFIAKMSYKTFKNQAIVKGKLTSHVNEMIYNQKTVIAYNHQTINTAKFDDIDEELYKYGVNAQFYSSLANPTTRFVNAIIYLCVATFGSYEVINNPSNLSVGMLSVFLSYASQYTKPFNSISAVATELQNSFASLRRIFELLDENQLQDESNKAVLEKIDGNITFNNVEFNYSENKPLITNLNLVVKAGEQVAIVGPTGCGKTTLINLLMRFYDINSGAIIVDSNDIYSFKRNSLRENIGMVLQDTWLFKGTIYENIRYGNENASFDEVIDAAKRAFAHEFIMKLPNGYDTIVSKDAGMSEGQKQLLCIARLMLRLPNILILDEATSNIDTRTEIMVSKAFKEMMNGRTTFIIAHRLSTIKNADKIIVMNEGKIVEEGTHDELLKQGGMYKSIYNAQFQIR